VRYKASKWTKDMIIEGIRHHFAAAGDLTMRRTYRLKPRLVGAAVRHFGAWRLAVEAAGFDYNEVRRMGREHRRRAVTKWTHASILREVQHLWRVGEDIRAAAVSARLPGLHGAARKHFGSWAAVLKAAGIPSQAVEAAMLARRGWKSRWLEHLKAQACSLEMSRLRDKRDYRRAFALPDNNPPSEWLNQLIMGIRR